MSALGTLIKSAEKAIDQNDEKEACHEWQKHLGGRFPCHLARNTKAAAVPSLTALKTTAAISRPWSPQN